MSTFQMSVTLRMVCCVRVVSHTCETYFTYYFRFITFPCFVFLYGLKSDMLPYCERNVAGGKI